MLYDQVKFWLYLSTGQVSNFTNIELSHRRHYMHHDPGSLSVSLAECLTSSLQSEPVTQGSVDLTHTAQVMQETSQGTSFVIVTHTARACHVCTHLTHSGDGVSLLRKDKHRHLCLIWTGQVSRHTGQPRAVCACSKGTNGLLGCV